MASGNQDVLRHIKLLESLCRICGKELPPKSNHILSQELKKNISDAFVDSFKNDKPEVNPNQICNNCYAKAQNFLKRGSIHGVIPIPWTPHTENCSVCTKLTKRGRPKKTPGRKGRPPAAPSTPKKSFAWTDELLSSIYLKSPVTTMSLSLKSLDIDMETNKQLKNILCCFCKDIIRRPVILNCGDAYCSSCLVNHLKSEAPAVCVSCHVGIPPSEDYVRPGLVLNRVVETVNVNLKCGCSVQISEIKTHHCPPLKTPPSSQPISKDILEFVGQVVGIQMRQSSLPNNTIQLPSGGPLVSV